MGSIVTWSHLHFVQLLLIKGPTLVPTVTVLRTCLKQRTLGASFRPCVCASHCRWMRGCPCLCFPFLVPPSPGSLPLPCPVPGHSLTPRALCSLAVLWASLFTLTVDSGTPTLPGG